MDGVGLAVDFDVQFVASGVGAQVDAGAEEGRTKLRASSWRRRVSRASWTRVVSAR